MVDIENTEPEVIQKTFTPLAAERITGVTRMQQRNWRRFGYLGSNGGAVAEFYAYDLVEIWVIGMLAERGIGPARGRKAAASIALRILAHAEQRPAAFPADILPTIENPTLYFTAYPSCGSARFFVWFPNDLIGFGDHVEDLIAGRGLFGHVGDVLPESVTDLRASGALIVLDLESLAIQFLERTGPLFQQNPASYPVVKRGPGRPRKPPTKET